MMASRDKDTKSLQDKLKVFFKKGAASQPARNELIVSAELERELGPETPLHRRLRVIKEVGDKALSLRIRAGGVEKIWSNTKDLLIDSNPEVRHPVLIMLRTIAEGQTDCLFVMRSIMFRYLRDTNASYSSEDYPLRFSLLHTLTNAGRNITDYEEEIGLLLLEWLPQLQTAAAVVEFLELVINVVKYNATYLDEEVLHGIINNACQLGGFSADSNVVQCSLTLLAAIVSYSLLPRAALRTYVATLCRTVNIEIYCKSSWKLMRSVVGADIGYAALQELVEMITSKGELEPGLVRGAVFFMNMSLWGPRRVPTMKVSYLAVLSPFLKAVELRQPAVTYEVLLALQNMVSRGIAELDDVAWDVVFNILRAIIDHDKLLDPPNELIHSHLHGVITALEQLHDSGNYSGDVDALLDLVDYCGHERPESSTIRLVNLRASSLSGSGWAADARALSERYIRREPRRAVRTHALQALHALVKRHWLVRMEEALEGVALPMLMACASDADAALRTAAARAAADLAVQCTQDYCVDLIDLLEKILNRPFEMYLSDVSIPQETDVSDLRLAVSGLVELFHAKLLRFPATHAMRCFVVLLDHLESHYRKPAIFANFPDIRMKILEMLFGLRANSFNNVGYCYDANGAPVSGGGALRLRPVCSPFLLVEPLAPRGAQPPPARDLPSGYCILPAGRVALTLVSLIGRERDWLVCEAVLRALPSMLAVRAPGLGRRAQELDVLATALLSLAAEKVAPNTTSELHTAVLPALAALAPYHTYLEPLTLQRTIQSVLKFGMVLRCPQPYINALTIFTLETRDMMVKMLPGVLLDLSKISDTRAIAGPMLEFLSTLTRLPRVFASFVEDQYMSVFAILLPYTNPSRYTHYVVSLAHHVIAAWFLKCRLAYRRNFVQFIIQGLHNYIIMPFEEQYRARKQPVLNEDSSNRKRSSSLGAKGTRSVPSTSASVGGAGAGGGASAPLSNSAAFHVELTETCVDLLTRYTFTPISVKPQRSDIAKFIFNGGQSTTWIVGHKLITITTSGCQQNSIKNGLCERCAELCKQHADSVSSPLPPLCAAQPQFGAAANSVQVQIPDSNSTDQQARPPDIKRYSKHSLQHSRSTETSSSSLSISDALLAPSSGHTTRQNSSENSTSTNYNQIAEVLNQYMLRFERISKEVDNEEPGWSRVGGLVESGACPCWCAQWCEVQVRAPSGDASWVLRAQNHMSWDHLLEAPMQEVLALLTPQPHHAPSAPTSSASSGIGDSRPDVTFESEPRSRSGSSTSQNRHQPPPQDLHKSSSDSVVAGDKKHFIQPPTSQPLRKSTQPINIPSSPQRQSSSSTTDDDDMLLIVPEGKSRHPVRRSNSSPEMSSSWKLPGAAPPPAADDDLPLDPEDMILLPSCEPTSTSIKATKKCVKKSDMRVSCEAIPEEMGTSPLAPHPLLMTYNSDPGTNRVSPDAAVEALPAEGTGTGPVHLQKVASDSTVLDSRKSTKPPTAPRPAPPAGGGVAPPRDARDDLPPLARSKRSNTISVMNPTRRNRDSVAVRTAGAQGAPSGSGGLGELGGGGITPSFVLLQLYHNMSTYPFCVQVPGEAPVTLNPLIERPLKVTDVSHERTIKNLDLVPPVETYKVGVLYVGPGQHEDEVAILKNEYGSVRYSEFLSALGTLVSLDGDEEHPGLFLNLEKGGKDGHYTYVWNDDVMQVLFHVATAMPYSERDPMCNEKRKYIGNDYVSIVYNDSGEDFNILTIKGQLNFCIVVVEPLEHGVSRVELKTKDERIRTKFLSHLDPHVVSDCNVALLARQHALHAALASHISQSLKLGGAPYASNSLERLRHIKRLRRRLVEARLAAVARAPKPYAEHPELARRVAMDDFSDYT